MSLKLMYITNDPNVACIAEKAGVDRIFVDMEYLGKEKRQAGLDTVKSRHTMYDVINIRKVVKNELIVRCNPIHDASDEYTDSKEEINSICEAGADIIMLPYFKSVEEVNFFINTVNKRARTMILVETPEAVEKIDEILDIPGIDEVHIGLNDLSLGYGMTFMFELLTGDIVEKLCEKLKERNIPYGIGGIASLGKGLLPAEHVIAEQYRLESTCTILSRSFCNVKLINDLNEIEKIFKRGIKDIRNYELFCKEQDDAFFIKNKEILCEKVNTIVRR